VGQCTYFVTPPDGHVYANRPSNNAEAEKRRSERFQVSVPSNIPIVLPVEETNPIFPATLDLRLPLRLPLPEHPSSASPGVYKP
jgi:uncharacterized protein (DUF2126 family)